LPRIEQVIKPDSLEYSCGCRMMHKIDVVLQARLRRRAASTPSVKTAPNHLYMRRMTILRAASLNLIRNVFSDQDMGDSASAILGGGALCLCGLGDQLEQVP